MDAGKKGKQVARSIGTDLIEIARIERILAKYGQNFCRKVFTSQEVAYCYGRNPPGPSLAARFAAKEAVAKALGTGFQGIGWRDIEITTLPGGQPGIELHGQAQKLALAKGISKWLVSLAHSRTHALAVVIGE
jgi:holo-[acyl-carrier protein] synthase